MANSRTRKINYTPRYTQIEAYDLLPRVIRDVMKEGPQEWDSVYVLNTYRKVVKELGVKEAKIRVARMVRGWHANEILAGKCWRDKKPGQSWYDVPPSPHMAVLNDARNMVLSR